MKSSDLFSHPHQSEFKPNEGGSRNQSRTLCSPHAPTDSSVAMPPSS